MTRINNTFLMCLKLDLKTLSRANTDLFAWTAADMPGIDQKFMSYQLSVFLGALTSGIEEKKNEPR